LPAGVIKDFQESIRKKEPTFLYTKNLRFFVYKKVNPGVFFLIAVMLYLGLITMKKNREKPVGIMD